MQQITLDQIYKVSNAYPDSSYKLWGLSRDSTSYIY